MVGWVLVDGGGASLNPLANQAKVTAPPATESTATTAMTALTPRNHDGKILILLTPLDEMTLSDQFHLQVSRYGSSPTYCFHSNRVRSRLAMRHALARHDSRLRSHKPTVLSSPPEASTWPSELKATLVPVLAGGSKKTKRLDWSPGPSLRNNPSGGGTNS